MNQGYFSNPTLSNKHVAFISDDDLWIVDSSGGISIRLTANKGIISSPSFSPDGLSIALISSDHSSGDIYIISAEGGALERLTWLGVSKILGWKDTETLYFTSGLEGYPRREMYVYELNIKTKNFKKIELGPCSYYYKGDDFQILGRHSGDSARWKRYQGGTAGVLWTQVGKNSFERILKNLKTNIARPVIVNKTIYFISDHEGVANIYSCNLAGQNINRITNHTDYYVRNLSLNPSANQIAYQCGADIWMHNLKTDVTKKIEIHFKTSALQASPRFEKWNRYFHAASVHPSGSELAVVTRGHLFQVPPFSGVVKELDLGKDIRYSHPDYNYNGTKLIVAAAHGNSEESIYEFNTKTGLKKKIFSKLNWGKIWTIKCSPKSDLVAVITNRHEVYVLDLKKNSFKKIETNQFGRPADIEWSPDGRYLVYTANVDERRTGIRIYDIQSKKLQFLLNPIVSDTSPSFDPEGKYLYFLGVREFAPNYNETHFDLGFPFAVRPYVVSLQSLTASPFENYLENPKEEITVSDKIAKKLKKTPLKIEIDFKEIDQRILPFKLELGGYQKIVGIKGGVLYWKADVVPIERHDWSLDNPNTLDVFQYKFEDNSDELYQKNNSYFVMNHSKSYFLGFVDSKLRLLETKSKPSAENKIGKKDGWVDTSPIKLKINPREEWQQMYHEAWTYQKEHFWRKDLNKIDWNLVYKRYETLMPKVNTRTEFSDLMWEMQGELGTSHCYEMNGNYDRFGLRIPLAQLGAIFTYSAKTKSYTITNLPIGDSWDSTTESPLKAMGVSLNVGDQIFAINGVEFKSAQDLYQTLENKVNVKMELSILRKGSKKKELVTIRANLNQSATGYRNWVTKNKNYVHEKSNGKLGYVHIPDMGSGGYAEFYRHYIVESQYEGLVVDLRFNGGGHVSQHLLKVLAQKKLGFDETRYQGIQTYPSYAPGVLVALANEYSGSDGDIFPMAFKLMKLGKLVGKRTWGGVIGINGQYSLRDGTYVTQPEYSFWFKDVEWSVENYGVDPDIEVEITPEDYVKRRDPQLDRGIQEALTDLKHSTNLKFKPTYYPDQSTPKKLVPMKKKIGLNNG
ncbi:MAG: S41 family peptidase [Pseudobdellovibrio sp.]